MKAWEIVGYTGEGFVLCTECHAKRVNPIDYRPIFASDDDWEEMTCDECNETLADVELNT